MPEQCPRDIALKCLEREHLELYSAAVTPVYETVKCIIDGFPRIGYGPRKQVELGSRFVDDLDFDSLNITALFAGLGEIPNEDQYGLRTVADAVLYMVCSQESNGHNTEAARLLNQILSDIEFVLGGQ